MPEGDKWIAGTLPKRSKAHPRPGAEVSRTQVERLARANKKHLVGRPLAAALQEKAGGHPGGTGISMVAVGGCLVAGGAFLGAGIFFARTPLFVTGVGILVAVALLFHFGRRRPKPRDLFSQLQREAAVLDAYLSSVSPELPPGALATLARIKETLACTLAALASSDAGGADLPAEEHFFAQEMVSRYLPDACRHYLEARAAAGGKAVLADGRSAEESLSRQLEMLHGRLEKTLVRIAAGKAEELANHEVFLRTKQ